MREAKIALLLLFAAAPLAARGQGVSAQSSRHAPRGEPNVITAAGFEIPGAPSAPHAEREGYIAQTGQAVTNAKVWITRQRAFSFPVVVPPARSLGGEPALVELYVSADRGANWQRYEARNLRLNVNGQPTTPPPEGQSLSFTVQLDRDGEYYFASRILDALNRPLYQPAQLPEQRVIIDATPPRLEFTATATVSGEVHGQWRMFDEHLNPATLALEYQPAVNQAWQPVAFDRPAPNSIQTSIEGVGKWFPHTNGLSVTFRARVEDWAGNSAVVPRTVTFESSSLSPALPSSNNLVTSLSASGAAPPSVAPPPSPALQPAPAGAIPWPDERAASNAAPPLPTEYPRRADTIAVSQSTAPPLLNERAAVAPLQTEPATTNVASATPLPSLHSLLDALPAGERPRMTSAKRFDLDYDVSSVGPQGVAKVELWLTRDGGRSWQAWSTDPDRESPMEVSLPEEGVYGFRVVVTGRNGLSGPMPRSGEPADVWIGIDATTPVARFTAARYGEGNQAGQLDIRWEADDVMLAARPVTLLFGESPQGPWTIVATGLPNSGAYSWPVDPRTPQAIYLRLEVRDEAGNVAIDQLREPITLEGLRPKAHVRGIKPVEEVGFQPRPSVLFR